MGHIMRIDEMCMVGIKDLMDDFFKTKYIIYDREGSQIEWLDTEDEAVEYAASHPDECALIYRHGDEKYGKGPERTVCIDFDGVIHDYSDGWQGLDVFGEAVPGAADAIKGLKTAGWMVVIHTCRKSTPALHRWLKEHNIAYDFINANPFQPINADFRKPMADIYIDDCAIGFNGDWGKTLGDIDAFKAWYKK